MAQAPVAAGTGSAERQETETEKKVMEKKVVRHTQATQLLPQSVV